MDHLASGARARSRPPDPIPQTLGSRLQPRRHEPDHEPIRRPIARLRHRHLRRSKVWQALPDARECFSSAGGFLIALPEYQLSAPTIVHDPTRRQFPIPVRIVLRLIGANDFMQLSTSHAEG